MHWEADRLLWTYSKTFAYTTRRPANKSFWFLCRWEKKDQNCCSNIPQCMMSLLKPAWPWGFLSQEQRSPHIPAPSSPVSMVFPSSYPPPQNPTVSLWSPCWTKEPLSLGHKVSYLSPIASRALEAFSLKDAKQLPVLTHHKLPATKSTQSSLALLVVTGPFGFSLCLFVPPISAWSIGHCANSILGAMLIDGQFSALLNNNQRHSSAPLDLVVCRHISKRK